MRTVSRRQCHYLTDSITDPLTRSFVPPSRDEESETQRKAHAKRVRETRRSTQGVTLDEIKSAEELIKKNNMNNNNNVSIYPIASIQFTNKKNHKRSRSSSKLCDIPPLSATQPWGRGERCDAGCAFRARFVGFHHHACCFD